MSNAGKVVHVHYRGTLQDGTEFDSSYNRNEPLVFTCMAGQMIKGFDAAVDAMVPGQKVTVTLEPQDAYGEYREDLVLEYPLDQVPLDKSTLTVGSQLMLTSPTGQHMPATIKQVTPQKLVLDLNHELAGKPLTFEIELLEVEE